MVAPVPAVALSEADKTLAKSAFRAVSLKRWQAVERASSGLSDVDLKKVFDWIQLSRPENEATLERITAFRRANPLWPRQTWLQRRAEEKMMEEGASHKAVLAFYDEDEPLSAGGMGLYGRALLSLGEIKRGQAFIRRGWIKGNFNRDDERSYLAAYRSHLGPEHHAERLDRLLWEGRSGPARRMLARVPNDLRKLAEARLALRGRKGGVDRAIRAVPKALQSDPGLVYERLRWRRKKGRDQGAIDLFPSLDTNPPHLERWWTERSLLARRSLRKGHITDAYMLARDHGLTEGVSFAEGEWMAGWIALRFLAEPANAFLHFKVLYDGVRYPISKARAAYWAGRAAAAGGKAEIAEQWFQRAAKWPTTYYGQLAHLEAYPGRVLPLSASPKPTDEEKLAFGEHELRRIVVKLAQLDQSDWLRPFLDALGKVTESPGWAVLTADLAAEVRRPDLGIRLAKRMLREGHILKEDGFPTVTLPSPPGGTAPERALVLATIRQESAFRIDAKSRAGARGLMQLMPGTANRVARRHNLRYSKAKLTIDPDYNLKLGQAYMAGLIERFDGSYVMALAGYNAGPSRVNKWLEDYGDPRKGEIDMIDWIELIPFRETRTYVQRVMENLQVYRHRLYGTQVALKLEKDLAR